VEPEDGDSKFLRSTISIYNTIQIYNPEAYINFKVFIAMSVQIVLFWIVTTCTLVGGTWRCTTLKCWYPPTLLHAVTTQKTTIWIQRFWSQVTYVITLYVKIYVHGLSLHIDVALNNFSISVEWWPCQIGYFHDVNKASWEKWTGYFPLIQQRPHRNLQIQKFFYCCIKYWCHKECVYQATV
jgi:hypothetical protein